MSVPRILVIAGSDSGGGAGIQADIKTITMLGGHAMTAITAVTAQNTLGVRAVHPIPTDIVLAQIDSVIDDIGVDAVKIGMIGSAGTAEQVADRLERLPGVPIVFDPVMITTSGVALADPATIAAFGRLMAVATVTTPNIPELAALGGDAALVAAEVTFLAKGGDAEGKTVVDRLLSPLAPTIVWEAARIHTRHHHGTGCTLASAIALNLARGLRLEVAIARARQFVRIALSEAPGLGKGQGPMGHAKVRLDLGADMRLNQVTLPAHDYGASVAFYRALGLTQIVGSPPRYARFECEGGATLSIETGQGGAGGATIYFECTDLDAVIAALPLAIEAPVEQPWRWREARLSDPAGNRLCLYQADVHRRFPDWRLATADPVG